MKILKLFYTIILITLLSASSPFAEIYKWVDENGITHFGEQIPQDQENADLEFETIPEEQPTEAYDQFIVQDKGNTRKYAHSVVFYHDYKSSSKPYADLGDRLEKLYIQRLTENGFIEVSQAALDSEILKYFKKTYLKKLTNPEDTLSVYQGEIYDFGTSYIVIIKNFSTRTKMEATAHTLFLGPRSITKQQAKLLRQYGRDERDWSKQKKEEIKKQINKNSR